MRCSRIEFKGYRRLAVAATSIDGEITAFVGFNEAGKTTLLSGLEWFTAGGALRATDKNRSRPPLYDSSDVVRVFFELSDDDKKAIAHIPCDQPPTSISLARMFEDKRHYSLIPRPRRPVEPFASALVRLRSARKALAIESKQVADEDEDDGPFEWAATVEERLEDPNVTLWDIEHFTALAALREWLLAPPPKSRKAQRDARLASLLGDVEALARRPPPEEEMWQVLGPLEPRFVLYRDEHRVIESTYELTPQQRAISPAVTSLLNIAGVSVDTLWTHIQNGDSTNRETLLERGTNDFATYSLRDGISQGLQSDSMSTVPG